MEQKRWKARLAFVLALVLLFLILHVALEADHDCHGDTCAICARIHNSMELLRNVALTLALALAAVASRGVFLALRGKSARTGQESSLVSLKVKLSD